MAQDENVMHIAIAFDRKYITPFYVLLTSLFQNNSSKRSIVLHAIAPDITKEERSDIQDFIKKNNSAISFYEIESANLQGLVIPKNTWFSIANYYRLFFAALVPAEVEKLLYIDTDTVVVKDLYELYQTNVGTYPAGAVEEDLKKPRPDLGIYTKANYFNSGVLLISITEWKKQQISEKALQYMHDHPERMICVDQDALNGVMLNNWFKLEKRYNVMFQDVPANLTKRKCKDFLKDKFIIHFSVGTHKPWNGLCQNRFRYLYHQYLKMSPRSFEKKYTDFKVTPYNVYKFGKIRVREVLLDYPHSLLILKKVAAILFFFLD